MKVSVVVPTFNRAFDLSKLFDCLLKQTTEPSELIIVDDNTPNESIKNVCEAYKTSFRNIGCVLIYSRNRRGNSGSICRNVGVKLSSGDIVIFFDDDMLIYEDYIEKTLEVFKMHPEALGVQGWIPTTRKTHFLFRVLDTIFFGPSTRDRCRLFGYPTDLTRVINCEALCGGAMAIRKEVFNEFMFDENLKMQSFMEDDLFSYSIFQKYPNALFITPFAKGIHKKSRFGRAVGKQTERLNEQYRRYVLVKLFGNKGYLLYCWQSTGITIVNMAITISKRNRVLRSAREL